MVCDSCSPSSRLARYPDIIDLEADYIRDHSQDPTCFSELPMWMDMAVQGDLPHASAALVALVRKLAGPPSVFRP